jgi:hypothetical protein
MNVDNFVDNSYLIVDNFVDKSRLSTNPPVWEVIHKVIHRVIHRKWPLIHKVIHNSPATLTTLAHLAASA